VDSELDDMRQNVLCESRLEQQRVSGHLCGCRPMVGRIFRSADSLAREHTERAIEVLAEVMDNPVAEDRDRISAADRLLDRGHGKPLTATIALPANRAQAALLAAMSDDDLLQAISSAQLPRLTQATDADIISDPLLR
jgi:hypothetical protein